MAGRDGRARVVIVGGGFAGFSAARRLQRVLDGRAELTLVSPTDFLLYSPLLPEVATGTLDPRDIAVPLRQTLPAVTRLVGHTTGVDLDAQTVDVVTADGGRQVVPWDRLVLVPGSVTRLLDIPGVAAQAHGLKTLAEATFLRNHLIGQLDQADVLPDTPAGRAERQERLTVVAVGAGYTGTEFVAQAQHWMRGIAARSRTLEPRDVHWILVDVAPQVLPELGPRLGRHALQVLADRGVDVRLQTSVSSAGVASVTLTDGSVIATRTLIWGAGVIPSPLVATLGLPTSKGRLVVDPDLSVPGAAHVWSAGDAAAVPDLAAARGHRGDDAADNAVPLTAPTAQHAQRQGRVLARNVAASVGVGTPRRYRHRDLGLVADLGGTAAVARPLGVPLTGWVAKVVARGYHLYALPSLSAKVRVATDWVYASILPTRVVQLDNVRTEDALVTSAQSTGIYRHATEVDAREG